MLCVSEKGKARRAEWLPRDSGTHDQSMYINYQVFYQSEVTR
jgi:hypothetical protein